jgi:hypothetical protein
LTITIFKDKDCNGGSQVVNGNIRDLKDTPADKPGSIRLTQTIESVLLFKNDDWHGGALFIRGKKTVSDLGSAKEGGRFGFGNSIRSVRFTPFTLKLNATVVKNGDKLPGVWVPNELWTDFAVEDVVKRANSYYSAQHALLNLEIARIIYRDDCKHFDLTGPEAWKFPGDWKRKGEVDLIFINRFEKEGKIGNGKPPCFGQALVVATVANLERQPDQILTNEDMAVTLAHELGHYLGLGHGTADKNANNIMTEEVTLGTPLSNYSLWDDQIREMQDRLANHHTRRGDRND